MDKQEQSTVEEARVDVKSQVARTLIEAMEQGNTPWQKPWTAQSLRPINATTNRAGASSAIPCAVASARPSCPPM